MRRLALLASAITAVAVPACASHHRPAPTPAPASPDAAAPDLPHDGGSVPWTLPAGWRNETIPFPLEFAPDLPYRGVEELRFAPGMFDPAAPDYFSYGFVWYLRPPGPADRGAVERDLVAYFAGLAHAVDDAAGGADRSVIAGFQFHANLTGDLAGASGVTGVVDAFDPFAGHAAVHLHVRVTRAADCPDGRTALVFVASPREPATGDAVWTALDGLAADFRCR